MVQALLAVLSIAALVGMSLRANRRFVEEDRLPMQWSFTGSVNWTAPRFLALSFTPALAAIVLSVVTIGTIVSAPRPGQEGLEIPTVILIALGFIGAHALHLRLIHNAINANHR